MHTGEADKMLSERQVWKDCALDFHSVSVREYITIL